MDKKCVMCHKNVPVIFTTRFENGKTINEGICLSCAYKNKIGGLDEMFQRSGINDDNVDQITEQLNQALGHLQENAPDNLLAAMFGGEIPEDISMMLNLGGGDDEEDDDEYYDDEDYEDDELEEFETSLQMLSNKPPRERGVDEDDDDDQEEMSRKWPQIFPPREKTEDDKGPKRKPKRKKRKYLDQFGRNLNDMAKEGRLDPLIGKEKELNRVVQILNRRSKNNPVLLGEPGVGKTAIAEGLASRIVEGKVPEKLQNMEVYLLDMTAMVAGTQFRGQFESRMKGVVDEATKESNIILVIDELHNIMGAGDAEGAMNAANILKPALARGEIRVLGSTTLDEYRRFVEKDSALERRFQKVIIDPPSEEEALEILQGLRPQFEAHHFVKYPNHVLAEAIRLSNRYISDRFLPDKAIDLIDEAGSKANLLNEDLVTKANLEKEVAKYQNQLDRLANDFEVEEGNHEQETAYYAKQAEIRSQKLKVEEELEEVNARLKPTDISEEDIAEVVATWTGIPVKQLTETEQKKLLNLEDRLHERLIGQDKAVSAVSRALRRNRAGLRNKKRPASFIFVGPTGVGKTELVKALAEVMFNDENAMIRLDMSEFMEAHTVSKMLGSPPGYVGYDDGGQLTEKVRRKPYSVLLFDEIEKAHADVFNILLQILDEGRLTDSHGHLVDFSNTIIIMTSNVGTSKGGGYGFGADREEAQEDRVMMKLREFFRPEFLNRIDEVVVFHTLTPEEIRQIVDLMLKEVNQSLRLTAGVEMEVSDEAKDYLAKEGYSAEYGARPLRRFITRSIEDPLSEMKLRGELNNIEGVKVDFADDKLVITTH